MISQLTGSLVDVSPTSVVLDVGGIGFVLGVSATTVAALPQAGSADITLLTRMVVKENAMEFYGFASDDERAVFDRLITISGVGPKLALAVLSSFAPAALATIVTMQDVSRMAQVPGVGKKKAQRLLMELSDVFAKDATLRGLTGGQDVPSGAPSQPDASESTAEEATSALLSMGFTPQECDLALKGHDEAGATTLEQTIAYALRRLGGGA